MPNASGVNQFGGFPETIPYGDKARQGTLQRLAPLAGSSSVATDAPRRAQRAAVRGGTTAEPEAMAPPVSVAVPASVPPAQLYSTIAAIPGASDEVRSIFGGQQPQ